MRPQGLAHDRPAEASRRSRDVRLWWPGGCQHPWHLLAGGAGATAGRPFSTWKTWRLSVSLPSFEAITDSFSLERFPQLFKAELGSQRLASAGLCSSYEAQGGAAEFLTGWFGTSPPTWIRQTETQAGMMPTS